MKRQHMLAPISLVAIAALGEANVASILPPVAWAEGPTSAASDVEVDISLANLVAFADRPSEALAQLEHLRVQLAFGVAETDADPVIGTLPSVFEAVVASARAGYMTHFEAAFLREQVIETRLDRILDTLARRAKSASWDEDVHRQVVDLLVTRARLAVGYPDAEAARARLMAILEDLRCGAPAVSFDDLRLELLRGRMVRFLQYLSVRARTLGVDRATAQPYVLMVIERGRLAARER
jgi:hypothetical protein